MSTHRLDAIDGERGIPAPGIRSSSRGRRAIVAGLVLLIVLGTVGALWWRLGTAGEPDEEVSEGTRTDLHSTVPAMTFPNPMEPEPEPELVPERVLASIDPMPMQLPMPAPYVPAPIPVIAQADSAPPLPADTATEAAPRTLDKSAMPIVLAQNNAGTDAVLAAPSSVTDAGGDTGFVFGGDEGQGAPISTGAGIGGRLGPTQLDATLAGRLSDQSLLIARGTMIDCALQTRIITALPGMTACTVTRNVYSDDGRILLVERGSQVTGEYRSDVQQGTNRVFVLWSRVKTPGGVVVDLDSPATDALGASGIPGDVDNHFWTRFGGAILLSLVDDVASAAARDASDTDGTQVNVGGSINSGSRVVEEVLRQTINIPPTVSVDQGARVGIYVARDLDFRSVYDVRVR